MANGADRLFEVMKNTSVGTQPDQAQYITLTVKSLQPLLLSKDDKLDITERFCVFDTTFNKSTMEVGHIIGAIMLNNGQLYYLCSNLSLTTTIAEMITPEYIDAILLRSYSIPEYSTSLPEIENWRATTSIGNNLTIENGKIKIGKGIHHIRVTATLELLLASGGDIHVVCRFSINNVTQNSKGIRTYLNTTSSAISKILTTNTTLEVTEGDTISLKLNKVGNGSDSTDVSATYLYSNLIAEKID